jgi:hypothetical protein
MNGKQTDGIGNNIFSPGSRVRGRKNESAIRQVKILLKIYFSKAQAGPRGQPLLRISSQLIAIRRERVGLAPTCVRAELRGAKGRVSRPEGSSPNSPNSPNSPSFTRTQEPVRKYLPNVV